MAGASRAFAGALILAIGVFVVRSASAADSQTHPGYLERAQTSSAGPLRGSAAALSAEESAAVFGVPLADELIQPVWVEVENRDEVPYWLLFPGLDRGYFPPSEAP